MGWVAVRFQDAAASVDLEGFELFYLAEDLLVAELVSVFPAVRVLSDSNEPFC